MEYWFRAKTLLNNQWEYGGVDDKNSSIINHHQFIPIDPATLGLYSGITDAEGNNVCHGDIVEMWINSNRLLVIVIWDASGWSYKIHDSSEIHNIPDHFKLSKSKVVGNIWDGFNISS